MAARTQRILLAACLLCGTHVFSATEPALVPAGPYQMGDALDEGWPDERPAHTVSVSDFEVERAEVSKSLWAEVRAWALGRGYTNLPQGAAGRVVDPWQPAAPASNDHPVVQVSWHDAVAWCNARSEKAGYTPVYYTDGTHSTVYRAGELELGNECANHAADGYRLPTEAEWEKAARGGMAGARYPWGATNAADRADYWDYLDTNTFIGTTVPGMFPSNAYGLADMAGNVAEWCWDRYGAAWYDASAGATDPRGPTNGTERVLRGGSWAFSPFFLRCASREHAPAWRRSDRIGFRCVRVRGAQPLWTAYNDCCWQAPQPSTRITTYAPFATNGWQTSGELVDYADGAGLGVTLSLSGGNYSSSHLTQGADAGPGTDAHRMLGLGTILSATGVASGGDITLQFSGLVVSNLYEVTLFGNRAEPGYTTRMATFTLAQARRFTNTSSTGVTVLSSAEPNDTAEYCTGANTTNGYVAQFSGVVPSTNGTVTVTMTSATGGRYLNAVRLRAFPSSARPQSTTRIAMGADWQYRKGTAEASNPLAAWRATGSSDNGWSNGVAPIGYGKPEIATALDDMQGNYTCVFLRKNFALDAPYRVGALDLAIDYDDGFILWINGEEVHRVNMTGAPGTFTPYHSTAELSERATWTQTLAGATLPALGRSNVVAVQVFNRSLSDSSDLFFDFALTSARHPLAAHEDIDEDGMPDDWEMFCFLNTAHTGDEDEDGDGLRNIEEWIAGTDPTTNASVLALDVTLSAAGPQIAIPTRAGSGTGYAGWNRYYALQSAGSLADTPCWLPVPGFDKIPGTGTTVSYTNSIDRSSLHRARVWLERNE